MSTSIPTRLVVAIHPKYPAALQEAQAIVDYLKKQGIDAPIGSLHDEDLRKRVKAGEFDVLIAVGGDGTILRAGHLCAPCGVAILGINIGKLGFLIQVKRDNWAEMLTQMLSGDYWIENRLMLHGELFRAGELQ